MEFVWDNVPNRFFSLELLSRPPPLRLLVLAEDLPSARAECRLTVAMPTNSLDPIGWVFVGNVLLVLLVSYAPRISPVDKSFVKHRQAN